MLYFKSLEFLKVYLLRKLIYKLIKIILALSNFLIFIINNNFKLIIKIYIILR